MQALLDRNDVSCLHCKLWRESTAQVTLAFFPNFTQNQMLILCSKSRSVIDVVHTSYQRHNQHTTGSNALKS